jgi:hypothetical protein
MKKIETGYLKRDIREWISAVKRCRWVTAWRIVDAQGDDMIFPWPHSKREARETANAHGIVIIGEYDER